MSMIKPFSPKNPEKEDILLPVKDEDLPAEKTEAGRPAREVQGKDKDKGRIRIRSAPPFRRRLMEASHPYEQPTGPRFCREWKILHPAPVPEFTRNPKHPWKLLRNGRPAEETDAEDATGKAETEEKKDPAVIPEDVEIENHIRHSVIQEDAGSLRNRSLQKRKA